MYFSTTFSFMYTMHFDHLIPCQDLFGVVVLFPLLLIPFLFSTNLFYISMSLDFGYPVNFITVSFMSMGEGLFTGTWATYKWLYSLHEQSLTT